MGSVDEERFTPLAAEIENETAETSKTDQQPPVEAPPVKAEKQPRLRLRGIVVMGKVDITS